MRPAELFGHVVEIGGKIGRDFHLGIGGAHPLDILGAALLRHLKAAAQRDRQHRQPFGHDARQDACPLAAADHQHAEHALIGQRGKLLVAQRLHFLAHRIADQMHLADIFVLEALDHRIGGGDRVDPAGEQAVDPAQHRILLMDRGRDAVGQRAQQSGHGGIAAKADHGSRLERVVETASHRTAGQDRLQGAGPARRILGHAARRHDMDLRLIEDAGDLRAPLIGDEGDMMAARHQFLCHRMRGNHVTTRPAGGEDEVTGNAHRPLHLTTVCRPMKGLRRVNASSRPTPIQSASIEEPP